MENRSAYATYDTASPHAADPGRVLGEPIGAPLPDGWLGGRRAEGWACGHGAWQDALFEAMCSCLTFAEWCGRWPPELGPTLVCHLPKGGTRQPGDRRPISLLSALDRVWAGLCVAEMRDWLRVERVLSPIA